VFIRNWRPSGDTKYCCLDGDWMAPPTCVANSGAGVPGSGDPPGDGHTIGTPINRSSSAMKNRSFPSGRHRTCAPPLIETCTRGPGPGKAERKPTGFGRFVGNPLSIGRELPIAIVFEKRDARL
jgi:hypothetical protein